MEIPIEAAHCCAAWPGVSSGWSRAPLSRGRRLAILGARAASQPPAQRLAGSSMNPPGQDRDDQRGDPQGRDQRQPLAPGRRLQMVGADHRLEPRHGRGVGQVEREGYLAQELHRPRAEHRRRGAGRQSAGHNQGHEPEGAIISKAGAAAAKPTIASPMKKADVAVYPAKRRRGPWPATAGGRRSNSARQRALGQPARVLQAPSPRTIRTAHRKRRAQQRRGPARRRPAAV